MAKNWQSRPDMLVLSLRAIPDEETRLPAQEFPKFRQSRRQLAGLRTGTIEHERHGKQVEGFGRYAKVSVYRLAFPAVMCRLKKFYEIQVFITNKNLNIVGRVRSTR